MDSWRVSWDCRGFLRTHYLRLTQDFKGFDNGEKNQNETQQTTFRKILIFASLFWDDFLYINAMPVFGVINLFWESVFFSTPHRCFKNMLPN